MASSSTSRLTARREPAYSKPAAALEVAEVFDGVVTAQRVYTYKWMLLTSEPDKKVQAPDRFGAPPLQPGALVTGPRKSAGQA